MYSAREAFAEVIEISSKFLYEIEIGKKSFSVDILYRISKALEVSCDYIIVGEKEDYNSLAKTISLLENLDKVQVSRISEILKILINIVNNKNELAQRKEKD